MIRTAETDRSGPGIIASSQPRGWLAKRWLESLTGSDRKLASRVARGKTFARGGRVQDLWFSPGLATGEVLDGDIKRVSIRMRVFEDAEWDLVIDTLTSQLTLVASLVEGDLPKALVSALEARGLSVLPDNNDLDGDCDCADYLMPCVHMSAVHQVLADALDGDPFLLFTLRGLDRAHLIARLRASWGDTHPVNDPKRYATQSPPSGDWLTSPTPLPRMAFDTRPSEAGALGLLALGPAPDGADLKRALGPLYDAASQAAQDLFLSEDATELLQKRQRVLASRTRQTSRNQPPEADVAQEEESLTERIVNALAAVECAKSNDLARDLGESTTAVRTELLELEEMGMVTRTGRTRGTRWWIG